MKILTVSDRVSNELLDSATNAHVKDVDLILGCGDLPPEFLSELKNTFEVPLYYILGNHDIRDATSPPIGCYNIDGRVVRFQNIRIYGLSGSRWYNGGAYQFSEAHMKRKIFKLRLQLLFKPELDIVLTHAPPRHIHDAEDPCHKGFRAFHTIIHRYQPQFFIHGHIHRFFSHEEERITRIGQTQVINSYGYHIIEI